MRWPIMRESGTDTIFARKDGTMSVHFHEFGEHDHYMLANVIRRVEEWEARAHAILDTARLYREAINEAATDAGGPDTALPSDEVSGELLSIGTENM